MRSLAPTAILAVAVLLLSGCAGTTEQATTSAPTTTPATSHPTTSAPTQSASSFPPNPFPDPSSSQSVYGSGSSFVSPLMSFWALQYGGEHSKVQVSYSPTGSGQGRKDLINKDVLFAGSDAPMSAKDKADAGQTVLTFPESLGPIGVVYNVNGVADGLHLDGETIGKILTGAITKWNDPAIKALNSEAVAATLPDATIKVVVRSDSSGTTFSYTDFLGRTSPTFTTMFGAGANSLPDWTKSKADWVKDKGNQGVGGTVKGTANSIGYVDLSFVKSLKLTAAAVKNQAGEFVPPTTAGATKAAASLTAFPAPDGDWTTVSIANAPGSGVYPISTFTYLLAYKDAGSYGSKATPQQVAAFKQFAWWTLHEGQQYSEALSFSPLPASVVAVGENALKSMS